MTIKNWTLRSDRGGRYFEFVDGPYVMRFSTGSDQAPGRDTFVPTLLKQVHSAVIIDVDRDGARVGDGLLTRDPRRVIGLKIADCLPVFLYNDRAMCIIHCGWRGILAGIAKKARDLLGEYSYTLGACIGVECYEVMHDVAAPFHARYRSAIIEKEDRYYLDLKKAVIQDLGQETLTADLTMCTKCHPEYFFSYRRGDRTKRNLALIGKI